MDEKQFINWMKSNGFLDISKHYKDCFKNILRQCLGVKNEEFLIIGDLGTKDKRISPIFTMGYYLAAKELNLKPKLHIRNSQPLGGNSEALVKSLADLKQESVITINLSGKLSGLGVLGKSFRSFAKKANHRFTSISNLDSLDTKFLTHIVDSMDIDYRKLRDNGQRIKKILDNGSMVHITTKKGTDLYYNIKGKMAVSNDGH